MTTQYVLIKLPESSQKKYELWWLSLPCDIHLVVYINKFKESITNSTGWSFKPLMNTKSTRIKSKDTLVQLSVIRRNKSSFIR